MGIDIIHKIKLLCIVLIIFFSSLLFLPNISLSEKSINNASLSQHQSFFTLNWEELTQYATAYDLQIIDFASFSNSKKKYFIHKRSLENRDSFIEFIIHEFQNVAVVFNKDKGKIYILPKGVGKSAILNADKISKQININSFFKDFSKSKETDEDLFRIPEIKIILKFAEQEKTKDIQYERVVNPQNPVSAYSFRVKYFDELKMMLPYSKNEKPISGEMEGFVNFYSIYNFIKSQADKIQVYRLDKKLFLKVKGYEKFLMMITGTSEKMTVVSTSKIFDIYFTGNNKNFQCMTTIYHEKGAITLFDIASLN